VRKADNLPPSCAVVTKSGNLKFQEPSGPLRALTCYHTLHIDVSRIFVGIETFLKSHLYSDAFEVYYVDEFQTLSGRCVASALVLT